MSFVSLYCQVIEQTIKLENSSTTKIGRDFFRGLCNDKRVSRSHGEVTVVGDQLKVKACHVNPIFYKRLSGASQVLAKDSEVLLNHLDKFSLMPNEFECEIRVVREETNERNATGEKLDEANNISDPERTPSPEFFKSSYQPMNGSNQVQNSLPDKETSRKRSLSKDDTEGEESKKQKQTPSTLLDTASDVAQSSTSMEQLQPTADESGLEETLPSVNVVTITPDPDGNVQAPTSPSAVTETSRKRSISKDDNDSEAKKQKQMPSSLPPSASDVAQSSAPLIQVQPKSESVSDKIIPVQNAVVIKPDPDGDFQGAASTSVIHTAPNAVVIKSEPTGDSPSSKPTLRPSCEYGIRCYRHTTEHRREFAHPVVDADYRRPDYPPARSDAPYCSFGSSCYRRNPEHFLEFKHPSANEYTNRHVPVAAVAVANDDDDDYADDDQLSGDDRLSDDSDADPDFEINPVIANDTDPEQDNDEENNLEE